MRKPVETPLECYGSEYDEEDSVCIACPHKEGCYAALGSRAGRVPLSRLQFDLCPEAIRPKRDSITVRLQAVYMDSYYRYYDRLPKSKISRDDASAIISLAKTYGVSPANYIRYVSAIYSEAYVSLPLSIKKLTNATIASNLDPYREAVIGVYGIFNLEALEKMLFGSVRSTSDMMFMSEVYAGAWIVGKKLRSGSDAVEELLLKHELRLNPAWLAIEESYLELIYRPHIEAMNIATDIPRSILSHRKAVSVETANLKNRTGGWSLARHRFLAREEIMPAAIKKVLRAFHMTPDDFEMLDEPVTDTLLFWSRLGTALQHFYCLRYIEGDDSSMRYLKSGGSPRIRS